MAIASDEGMDAGEVRVVAPARLHLGLIDLNGGLGRRFGSIGLAVDRPALDLTLRRADRLDATGPEADRVLRYLRRAAEAHGFPEAVAASVTAAMPAHAGFGSGTQLALAVSAALPRLHGIVPDEATVRAVSGRLDRGGRSGIGIGAFLHGGFLVDGGRGAGEGTPPLIARLPFPEDWRLVLVLDPAAVGVHGAEEVEAFRQLPVQAESEAAHLCRLVLMQLMPAIAEADLGAAGAALTEIQARVGDHFAPAQRGRRFASDGVAAVLAEAAATGAAGVGQTSWGPTGFVLVGSAVEAEAMTARLVRNCHTAAGLRFLVARGRNRGASIEARGG